MTAIPVFFPPRLWPSRYQYLLMGGAVLLTAALLGVAVYRAGLGLDAAQTGLQSAEAELATVRAHVAAANSAQTTSAQAPADLPPLPSAGVVDSVVRDMTAFAG
jgi:hypothetical protein